MLIKRASDVKNDQFHDFLEIPHKSLDSLSMLVIEVQQFDDRSVKLVEGAKPEH